MGDWEAVLKEVAFGDHVPLASSVRRLFQLRAELELGRHPDVGFAWTAIRLALGSATPKQQLYIAGYAEQTGFPAEAAPIYRRLLKEQAFPPGAGRTVNPQRLACYLGAVRTGAASMATEELAKLFGEFASDFPDMEEVQNDTAYLRVLLKQELEASEAVAERLVRVHPELLAYRTTAALVALRQGKIAEAQAFCGQLNIQWDTAPDRYKAVRVAVLIASQLADPAAELRATIRPETLRSEERELAGLR
jgi:hypothetical protein